MRRHVHSGSLGFTRARLRVAGFIRVRLSLLSAPWVRQVHSDLLGFSLARREVAGFIRIRLGSIWRAYGSPGSFGFPWYLLGRAAWFIRVDLGSLCSA